MKLSRSSRWYAAVIALISILFTQFAVAAYACPQLADGSGSAPRQVSVPAKHHAMPCCDQPETARPALCHAHAEVGKQSLDKPEPPPVQPFVAAGLALQVIPAEPADSRANASARSACVIRAAGPPIAILNCSFRV